MLLQTRLCKYTSLKISVIFKLKASCKQITHQNISIKTAGDFTRNKRALD